MITKFLLSGIAGYILASFLFPYRGWATPTKKPTDKDRKQAHLQNIEHGGQQTIDRDSLANEPRDPHVAMDRAGLLNQRKQSSCPGGRFQDADGVIYCRQTWDALPYYPSVAGEKIQQLQPSPRNLAKETHRISIA